MRYFFYLFLCKITINYIHKQINMTLAQKKYIFIELGRFLNQFSQKEIQKNLDVLENELFFEDFQNLIALSSSHNGWFTTDNVIFAVDAWAKALTKENLDQWLQPYQISTTTPKTVGLILAGNIPLVGFHDFITVLLSGHRVLIKTSSDDQHILPFLAKYIQKIEPKLQDFITFTNGKLEHFDAVIATGSNNTARYFEYYFRNKPAIIRQSRNSVAVLNGQETKEQMQALGQDIFRYFGLGCRNVSKIFIPRNYNFDLFFNGMFPYQDVIKYEKYANNYDYNKAVFLMSNFKLLDNEFLTIKEDESYSSPISSIFYEYYDDLDTLQSKLEQDKDKIQCIVSNQLVPNSVAFGQTQCPNLWDYADNRDTMAFLLTI